MKKKRILSLIVSLSLALTLIIAFGSERALAASNWSWRQDIVHQIADLARTLGLPEDHVIIAVCQDIWWADNDGRDLNKIGTYVSARTGKTYGYTSSNTNTGTYYDGSYWWYYDASYNNYYRLDSYGNKTWLNGNNTGYNTGRYSGGNMNYQNQQNQNRDGYYKGVNLYNGVITGVSGYVNSDHATKLAKLANTYCFKVWSETEQAAFMWDVLNAGAGNVDVALKKFDYNASAATKDAWNRDLYALAQDVLFRYQAENTGKITKVGRVLPSNYTWVWSTADGANYFRITENGANWTYDQTIENGRYKTPYST